MPSALPAASWPTRPSNSICPSSNRAQRVRATSVSWSLPLTRSTEPNILEAGCGSGILSSMLAPFANTLTGVDVSGAMVEKFNAKMAEQGTQHMEAVFIDTEHPEFNAAPDVTARLRQKVEGKEVPAGARWDMILSNLLAHHFPIMGEWTQIAYFSVAPGGRLVMLDYEHTGPDSDLFHSSQRCDHAALLHGVEPDKTAKALRDVGFLDVTVERVYSLEKAVDPQAAGGRTSVEFPIVMVQGVKPLR